MTPDFSPESLKGFLQARVKITAYMAAYPNPPKMRKALGKAEDEAKAKLRAKAKVTPEQFDLAWQGKTLGAEARLKLWRALNVDPAEYGIRLIDFGKQERMRDAA
jgi:hypothetical protein